MDHLVELVTTNGLAVAIIVYFLYKDFKFNDQIVQLLGEVREVLAKFVVLKEVEEN